MKIREVPACRYDRMKRMAQSADLSDFVYLKILYQMHRDAARLARIVKHPETMNLVIVSNTVPVHPVFFLCPGCGPSDLKLIQLQIKFEAPVVELYVRFDVHHNPDARL